MEIYGGGSLVVDSKNKLDTSDTGVGPFNYGEVEPIDNHDRYGEIEQVVVIIETGLGAPPFFDAVILKGFSAGTQLCLWYQDISPSPVDPDDTTFPAVTFPDTDPDVKFIGGRGANKFKVVVKRKRFDTPSQSHKKNRPNRYTHSAGGPMARHFRIGQWRLLKSDGSMLVGQSGADNYTLYVTYADYIP
jgi:hypothetical protein